MRALILSSLFAIGVGLVGAPAASAAPISGIHGAVLGSQSLVDQAQYYRGPRARCRTVRTCRIGMYGRRVCRTERVCRRW